MASRSVSIPGMASLSESERRRYELERLLEAISTGSIADVDELDDAQEALLRAAYPSDDDLQKLLDRLRGTDPEER
jgi:hypothetical protein